MKMPIAQQSAGGVLPPSDQECLARFRQVIEEIKTAIAKSSAVIDWSLDAIALLVRLEGPQISK
jgi:hypothetical protein